MNSASKLVRDCISLLFLRQKKSLWLVSQFSVTLQFNEDEGGRRIIKSSKSSVVITIIFIFMLDMEHDEEETVWIEDAY